MKLNFGLIYLGIAMLLACGDPGEQQANREKLIEGLDDHRVKRVTEEEILAAAFDQGRQIISQLEAQTTDPSFWTNQSGEHRLDSLNSNLGHLGIKMVTVEQSGGLTQAEAALLDAYSYSAQQGEMPGDNVQNTSQNILYTKPVFDEQELIGMWSITLSKKTLVRNL